MIIEALATATGILCVVSANVIPDEQTRFHVVGIDEARFRKPVGPGGQLLLTSRVERAFKGIWRFSTLVQVDDNEVAHARIMVAPETGK